MKRPHTILPASITACATLISVVNAAEPPPTVAWATNFYFESIQVGNDGSMYLGGANHVRKLDKRGTLIWAHQIGGTGSDQRGFRHGLHVDANEFIYLTGALEGTVTVGDIVLTNQSSQMFVAKFDRDGGVIWAKQTDSQQYKYGQDIGADAAGNVYVTGLSMGEDLPNTNQNDCTFHFLNKYDRDGNLAQAQPSVPALGAFPTRG